MRILINWLVATLAVMVAAYLIPGVTVTTFFAALVTALVLGLVNVFIRPILIVLTLPVNVLTLGLFTFVINAAMVLLVARIVDGFSVDGFLQALLFSLILALINMLLRATGREAAA